MAMRDIVVYHAEQAEAANRDDRATFTKGFLLEDADAKSVQDSTWLVRSGASSAREMIDNIVRHIRGVRQEFGPYRNLQADFCVAQIDDKNKGARLVTFQ